MVGSLIRLFLMLAGILTVGGVLTAPACLAIGWLITRFVEYDGTWLSLWLWGAAVVFPLGFINSNMGKALWKKVRTAA